MTNTNNKDGQQPNSNPLPKHQNLPQEEIDRLIEEAFYRIKDAKTKIVLNQNFKFWTYLLCSLEVKPLDTNSGTIATDGYKLYYDPLGRIHEWSSQELQGAIIHEIAHCAFGHYWRCGSRDAFIWNMATDYIINWILVNKESVKLPPNTLYDDTFNDEFSAEAIYSILIRDKEKAIEKLKELLDDPDIFKEAVDNANGSGDSNGDGENGEGGGSGYFTMDGMPIKPSDIRDDTWWQDKVQSAGMFAKSRGTLPAYLESLIKDFVEPKLPWRELLREFVVDSRSDDYRTFPFNKKYAWMGAYLPSIKNQELELAVAMDTSGSVSDEEATQFISELRAIADAYDNYTIHYMQCDTEVKFYEILTKENEHNWPMHVVGRGGTRFEPPFEKLAEEDYQPPIFVYLTDLGGSFPEQPPYPVLWISTVENANCPWGDRINIDVNDGRRS